MPEEDVSTGDVALVQTDLIRTAKCQQWKITKTSRGLYKIKAKSSEDYTTDFCMAAGDGILTSNGRNVEQRVYSNNTDLKDEWVIITPSVSVLLEAQKQSNWCWAASARMSSKRYMESPISQESAAVYVKLGVKTDSPTSAQIEKANSAASVGETEKALEYILGSDNVYSKWWGIYDELTLQKLLSNGVPIIILRGWYSDTSKRLGGHYVVIYSYHWSSEHGIYLYDIYDPSPVNTGATYSRSYQSIDNGRKPAYPEEAVDTGLWEGVVVIQRGSYHNTIVRP